MTNPMDVRWYDNELLFGQADCLLIRTCKSAHAVLTRVLVVYECNHNDDVLLLLCIVRYINNLHLRVRWDQHGEVLNYCQFKVKFSNFTGMSIITA